MNFKAYLSKFLTNKLVLNVVLVLAILNIAGYMVMGYFNNVLLFIIVAILVRYFSKNMIIVLGIPLLFVNLLSLNKNGTFEGLENNDKTTNKVSEEKHKETIDKINQKANSLDNTNITTPLDSTDSTSNTTETQETQETFEAGRPKTGGSQIDYASTIEDAYDQLNGILGSDGIKRLTDDTQNLMQQQAQLAESMKKMGPLIQGMEPMMKSAQEMMKNMNSDSLKGVMDMASNFTKTMGGK